MTVMNLIFEDEFMESNAYKVWHDSFVDLVNIGFEPINKFLDRYSDFEPEGKSSLTEEELKDYKRRINTLKIAHITKSIELGIYFQELTKKDHP